MNMKMDFNRNENRTKNCTENIKSAILEALYRQIELTQVGCFDFFAGNIPDTWAENRDELDSLTDIIASLYEVYYKAKEHEALYAKPTEDKDE